MTPDLGGTGMGSGKADTAVDTRSLSDPGNFILHLRCEYLDLPNYLFRLSLVVQNLDNSIVIPPLLLISDR